VSLFVPHQANLRIIAAVGERLGLAPEKVYLNLERVGNTSSASIPLAMREAIDRGVLKRGDLVLLGAFGGGLTWAATLLKW
jgi:3-oxoacyl-[acyl-carrier-protein] synthase-3